ncbi:hypothetical protein VHA01S_005_00520 [Vibrio halioticoli NBRC 102217]|uniref:Flp pilus assembly protein RcpC/CpaB domain-containing protein n=1 Tax=Vibrio halioticoli NBRC 102217 TaxID=1219072 RepID=V5F031_9VIBR|nr:hypothetical protein [Vibrio halioticoli]GAD88449.1 hypothetical protein VHA01S_005_00520 [Vibrio halioticoli NBRC 102217]
MKLNLKWLAVASLLAGPAHAAYEIQTTKGFEQTSHIYTGDTIREVGSINSFQTSGEIIVSVESAHASEVFDTVKQLDVQLVLSIDRSSDTKMVVINAGDKDLLDVQQTLQSLPGVTQVSLSAKQQDRAQ